MSPLHEARLAFRKLLRDPFLSGISVLALTLGIGLTASMFSIAYSVLARGMPFENADELLDITGTLVENGRPARFTSFLNFRDWAAEQSSFSHLGGWITGGRDLTDDEGRAERVGVAMMSPSMFPLLGERPALGRGFGPEDVGPDARVALLSDGIWRNRYGASPGILGSAIRLNGESYTVVGVMPPGFAFPNDQDLWLPLPYDAANTQRDQGFVRVLGRLPPDVPEERALAELEAINDRLARAYPETNQPMRIHTQPLVHSFIGEEEIGLLWTMVAASFFVLIIACANVANLLTARALDRSGDVAIATALGASRLRVVGELLTEALVLSLVGGALGIGIAVWFVDWFDRVVGPEKPLWMAFYVDGTSLAFVLGAAFLSALVAGLMPALRSASVSVREVLQDESRGASSRRLGRLSHTMVILTMALAYPLLVAAGLLIVSFRETTEVTAFDREGILQFQMSLPAREYPTPEIREALRTEFLGWVQGQPGVVDATWSNWLPSTFASWERWAREGDQYLREEDHPRARLAHVRPGFFDLLGVTPARGRLFDDSDRTGPDVAVVTEGFASRFFPGEDPLGRRIRIAYDGTWPWHTIVGVVPDLRMNGTDHAIPEGFFFPAPPAPGSVGYFLIRTTGDPLALAPTVRDRLAVIAPNVPIRRMETLADRIDQQFWFVSIIGSTFSVFGLAALFLASVGLYGVMAHSVTRRTREMGIRVSMGATGADVIWQVLRGGLAQVTVGLLAGTLLAYWFSRLLSQALFGIRPGDPVIMLAVAGVLTAAALVAMIFPALRAARLAPMDALRGE